MLKLFLKFELEKINKYFRTRTLAKVITSMLGLVIFLFIALGIYTFFNSGFRYINADTADDVKNLILLFIYEIFLLILAGIIAFSALVSSIFNLFKGQYNNWIISSPKYKLFPTVIFTRSLMTSLLPLCIVFFPVMAAFVNIYHVEPIGIVFILISIFLFLLIINLITLLFITVTGFVYYKVTQVIRTIPFNFKGFIILLTLSITAFISYIWNSIKNIDLVHIFRAEDVDSVLTLSVISNHFAFLPTHPLALEIISWQNKDSIEALANVGILFLLVLIAGVAWYALSPLFYPLWLRFQEGSSHGQDSSAQSHTLVYTFTGQKTSVLFKKEALILFRNWKGLLWFLFLSCIWLAQIGANTIIGHNIQKYQPDISQKIILLQVLQYIIAIYFISSFALRFVFPSFSVEKKTSWILGTAPINTVKIFFGKYLFYTLFLVSLGITMSYINIVVLNIPIINAVYSLALFTSTIILIVTCSLSLGALFPNMESDDPEVISTSMPGLLFTAFSLIYGACSDWVLYRALESGNFFEVIIFIIITIVIVIGTLYNVPRFMKRTSF